MLESIGWGDRIPLPELIYYEKWGVSKPAEGADWDGLPEAIEQARFTSEGTP
jgi:hypothetical protein